MKSERSASAGAPGSLGAETSRFVGRAARLDELSAALEAARLVTVTGTAGVGKTRLALEHARRRAPDRSRGGAGGALRIDLGAARSAADVAEVARAALGAPDGGTAALGAAARARGRVLLILDGCEHVVGHAAAITGALLSLAPELRCLATSRRPMRLPGERLFTLDPLALPAGPHEVEIAEASALFLDRARLEIGSVALDGEGAPAVVEIAARLGGLPLGLELCASRLQVMTLPELAGELARGLGVLGAGPRDATRVGALGRAFASSWELLSPWERSALAQASVFRGDFSLTAARRVLELSEEPGAPPFLDVMEALVERSLVARRAIDGGVTLRFRLYEVVRHFAAEELGEGRAAALDRHERCFLDLALSADAAPSDALSDADTRALGETDGEDRIAALQRALERLPDRPPAPARAGTLLAGALAADDALIPRGAVALRLSLLGGAIDAQNDAQRDASALLVRALIARAAAFSAAGRPAEAREDRRRARELGALVPDPRARAEIELGLAGEALGAGRLDDARALAEGALASLRALGGVRSEAEGLLSLIPIVSAQGELAAAGELAARASQAARGSQVARSGRLERAAIAAQGLAAHELGALDAAERHYARALAESRASGDRSAEAALSTSLGVLRIEQGMLTEARALLERAVAEHRAAGDRARLANALGYLGLGEEAQGLPGAARGRCEEAAALHREAERAPLEGLTLAWLGRLEASRDRVDGARRALDEARSRLFAGGSASLLVVYDLCEAHVAVAEARAARARGDERAAAACLARAGRVLDACAAAPPSIDVRLARASLARALEAGLTVAPASPGPARPADLGHLVVSASARWFRPPGGARVSLATRRALRCILGRLADERGARPGEPLEVAALLAAGWPGERVLHEAGVSRVYAAVAHLRRDGLRDVLIRRDDGYLLDPGVGLTREPE